MKFLFQAQLEQTLNSKIFQKKILITALVYGFRMLHFGLKRKIQNNLIL